MPRAEIRYSIACGPAQSQLCCFYWHFADTRLGQNFAGQFKTQKQCYNDNVVEGAKSHGHHRTSHNSYRRNRFHHTVGCCERAPSLRRDPWRALVREVHSLVLGAFGLWCAIFFPLRSSSLPLLSAATASIAPPTRLWHFLMLCVALWPLLPRKAVARCHMHVKCCTLIRAREGENLKLSRDAHGW